MTRVPLQPFYDRDGITIYNADCQDVLPHIDPDEVDLLLTDPPYGIGYELRAKVVKKGTGGSTWRPGHPPVLGDDEPFDPTRLLQYGRCVLFGANHYAHLLPPSPGWIAWDKTDRGRGPRDTFADVEFAWTNVSTQPTLWSHLWKGLARASEPTGVRGSRTLHPTQKPVALMRWIVDRWTEPDDFVLDPYMGSGPIAQACLDLGRRYIGVELVEDYCRVAVDRLAQGVLPLEAS